jgi:hypothetical protein
MYASIYQGARKIPGVPRIKGFPRNEADSAGLWPSCFSYDDCVAALVSEVYGEPSWLSGERCRMQIISHSSKHNQSW